MRRRRVAHLAAVATAAATFGLIVVGGIVHATDSGLACPDWPQCFGSFFPPMVGQVFYEHGHRIFATLVGNLTILEVILCWRAFRAGHPARALAVGALALVIFQGLLGGITVRMQLPDAVSTSHLATAMLFLALQMWLVFATRAPVGDRELSPRLVRAIAIAAAPTWVQIVLGALVRHTDAGLACTKLAGCVGADWRLVLHMAHRGGAAVVVSLVLGASISALRAPGNATVRTLALIAPGLVVVQVGLGFLSVLAALEVVMVTAHLATGALLLATLVAMLLGAKRVTVTSEVAGELSLDGEVVGGLQA